MTTANNKYEFTGETKVVFGVTLQQIRAISDFGNIGKGDVGGWIDSERNLSQKGNAWVSGNAEVSGKCLKTPTVLTGLGHTLTITDHLVRAGCECHPPSVWINRGKAIIKADGFSTGTAKLWHQIICLAIEAHNSTDQMESN